MPRGLRAVTGHVKPFPCNDTSHWNHSPSKAFAQDNDVRDDAPVLKGEHPASPAQADGGLIQDQEGPMAVTDLSHGRPVSRRRWNDCSGADRLGDNCANISFPLEHIVNVAGALKVTPVGTSPETAVAVGRRYMLGSR